MVVREVSMVREWGMSHDSHSGHGAGVDSVPAGQASDVHDQHSVRLNTLGPAQSCLGVCCFHYSHVVHCPSLEEGDAEVKSGESTIHCIMGTLQSGEHFGRC